jgi:hypothetical protein
MRLLPFGLHMLSVLGAAIEETARRSTFTPVKPPAIPLAVKSPYLSAWIRAGDDGGNGGYLAGRWPIHWTYVWLERLRKVANVSFQRENSRMGWNHKS